LNFFAKNIKSLRKAKGLTQAQMLDLLGFKQSTWNGYETGLSQPYMDGLIKISDFFNVSLSDLIERELNISTTHHSPDEKIKEKTQGNTTLTQNREKNYSSEQAIINTLSSAVRGLEAANSVLLQRIALLEEENNRLKKEIPEIGKGMEDPQTKSA
jgi:transcriptional regulator with XRE-family HTH domain